MNNYNNNIPPAPSASNQVNVHQGRVLAGINEPKIPNTIICIPEYSGEIKSLKRWIDHVDTVFEFFQELDIPMLDTWVCIIRAKIVGEADQALIALGCPTNWATIKEKLTEHFGDKKNLLKIFPLMKMSKGNKSLSDYYLEATKLIADIEQRVSLIPMYDGHTVQVMHFVNAMVTSAFIDGLPADLKSFVLERGAENLAEATSYAEKWQHGIHKLSLE